MNLQDGQSTPNVGSADDDCSVESPRSQQSRIKNIGPIRCRHNYQTGIWFKTLHFYQQLIQCLFSFVVSASQTSAPMSTHSIKFVYENNRRQLFLCGCK